MSNLTHGLTMENAAAAAEQWIAEQLPRRRYPEGKFTGRGVVIAAGGLRYTVPAWVCVRALRHVGCQLPIQVWHRGPAERVPAIESLLADYDVEFVDAYTIRDAGHPHARLNGYELKSFAVTWCPWEDVLFLDADNVPVRDPTYLFDWPTYLQSGAIFWPDYPDYSPGSTIWRLYGLDYRPMKRLETGQMLIDKRACWPALQLLDWYLQRSLFFFRYGLGDLDPTAAAWLKLGYRWAQPPRGIHTLRNRAGQHRTMCQHDFDGERIFQHHNTRKWSISDPWEDVPDLQLAALIRNWLAELRDCWSPAAAGFLTPEDSDAMRALIGRAYQYTRMKPDGTTPRDSRRIVLGPGGLIGEGAMTCEWFWCVQAGRLKIADRAGNLTMDLHATPPAGWAGRWLRHEKMAVTLVPIGQSSHEPIDAEPDPQQDDRQSDAKQPGDGSEPAQQAERDIAAVD